MILLQILTGRRASEIRTCEFDCLVPAPSTTVQPQPTTEVVRFRYAQSKIDIAPDTILVDREVAEVIEEQQRWVRTCLPGGSRGSCSCSAPETAAATNLTHQAPTTGCYGTSATSFGSPTARAASAAEPHPPIPTHQADPARRTRPAHPRTAALRRARDTDHVDALRRARDEHAEQAFLATAKLRSDGTRIQFSSDDHDSLHLFRRADRFLPNGWCLLPPLQSCDKGNACLTCSVFVTDHTHRPALQRQLQETTN